MSKSFGELLKAFREGTRLPSSDKRISQDKLADLLSHLEKDYTLTRETISRWENKRKKVPPREIVLDIANVLRLTVDEQNELLLAADYAPVNSHSTTNSTQEEILKSNVIPIDASLDVNDNYYSETQEGEIKKIFPSINPEQSNNYHLDIKKRYEPKDRRISCSFPAIDFKFQNAGRATALLWQFTISVFEADVDNTPMLDFGWEVINDELVITVKNLGWGDAEDFQAIIDQSILSEVFPFSARSFSGRINSGEDRVIIRLKKELISADKYKFLSTQNMEEFEPFYKAEGSNELETIHGIRISGKTEYGDGVNILVKWKCMTPSRKSIVGEQMVNPARELLLILTQNGFRSILPRRATGMPHLPSDVTYCCIIDPMQGPQELRYPMSRKIDSGGVDRFHFTIGAIRSCRLRVQFQFSVDKDTVIKSKIFDIRIWNPRNSKWEQEYADGVTLAQKLCEIRLSIEKGQLLPGNIQKLKTIRNEVDSFPFIEKTQGKRQQLRTFNFHQRNEGFFDTGEYFEAIVSEVKDAFKYDEAAVIIKEINSERVISLPIESAVSGILSEEFIHETEYNSFDTIYKIISNLGGEIQDIRIQFRQLQKPPLSLPLGEYHFLGWLNIIGSGGNFYVSVLLSEAIGIAIRTECPIKVSSAIFEEFGFSLGEDTTNDLNKSLNISNGNTDVLLSHASVLFTLKRYDEALQDCGTVLEKKPNDEQAMLIRGVILAEKGDLLSALEQLNQVLTIQRGEPLIFAVRARVLIRLCKYEEAVADLKKAIELKPDEPDYKYVLSSTYCLLQKYGNALFYLEKAIELDSKIAKIACQDPIFNALKEKKSLRSRFESITRQHP